MNNAWNLDGTRTFKKAWGSTNATNPVTGRKTGGAAPKGRAGPGAQGKPPADMPPMNYSDAQLVDKFREAIKRRGDRGIMGIGRAFKIADDDHSGSLSKEEF